MKVLEHLERAKGPLFSFEVLPPKKGERIDSIFEAVEALLPFKPAFIDVTAHAIDLHLQDAGEGLVKRVQVRRRPGTVAVCAAIQHRYGVDAVAHLICSGATREEIEDELIILSFLGIENVVALRGDPIMGQRRFQPTEGGHVYASDLIRQIADMNKGRYLHEDGREAATAFCIGAAGYPEKHIEAPNMEADIRRLKDKVDAGAEFIVTQMFFDNSRYFDFVAKCREAGIDAPIIPGLKPITGMRQVSLLPASFGVEIPAELADRIEAAGPAQARRVGIDWCIQQSRELVQGGAPCLHYYTMGKSEAVAEIAEAVFGA
jgi:methylenetetrahydrofolate reductase (NADPH)